MYDITSCQLIIFNLIIKYCQYTRISQADQVFNNTKYDIVRICAM